ncbi:MAG: FHA domain-containing protein [Solirubrobacteraceae bacterium]
MSPPTARLEVVAGNAAGMSILVDDELLIGRHAEGAGRLAEDEEISRSHARVTLEPSGFCAVEDLGSTNGTFVNGLRISSPQTLSEGDSIEIGATTLVVRDLPIPANAQTIEPAAPQPTLVPGGAVAAPPDPTASPATDDRGAAAPLTQPASSKLTLQLELDFVANEARIILGDGSGAVRIGFDGGAWTLTPPSD